MSRGMEISLTGLLLLLATGCASVVTHSDAPAIRKVALVSVYMNAEITGDYGRQTPPRDFARVRGLLNTGSEKGNEDQRQALVAYAANVAFPRQLTAALPWEVLRPEQVLASAAYRELVSPRPGTQGRTLSSLLEYTARFAPHNWLTPPEMAFIPVTATSDPRNLRLLKALCERLQVDAVVLLELRLGYDDGWLSVASRAEATPVAAASLRVVTRSGEVAVETPLIGEGASFHEGEGKVWVIQRQLELNEPARKLFEQTIDLTARKMATDIASSL